jgi:hypothetical protein
MRGNYLPHAWDNCKASVPGHLQLPTIPPNIEELSTSSLESSRPHRVKLNQHMLHVIIKSRMFARSLRRVATGSLLLLSTRTQQRTMSSFTLDRSIFKPALYKQVTNVWLKDVSTDGEIVDVEAARRWFMGTPEERIAFDGVCKENFGEALEAIGPANFPRPDAEAFLNELRDIARKDTHADVQPLRQDIPVVHTGSVLTCLAHPPPRSAPFVTQLNRAQAVVLHASLSL